MGKDVNIRIKVKGAQQTKQQLDSVGKSTEQMGSKTSRAAAWIKKGIGALVGPMGFAAIATAAAMAMVKVAKFFDELKARSDEAVRNVEELRKGYIDLFEAFSAFDEKSRAAVTKGVAETLLATGVSKQIGVPIIEAYKRQFGGLVESGQLTQQQYDVGLRGMLSYGARHGREATPELISLMRGWGMVGPEQQGAFRRQIAAAAQASGLTDEDVISALGRGMPTIKMMGWTPEQAVGTIATLAAGETGRKKLGLPATTLQALMAPQTSNLAKYGILEEITPQQLLMQLQMMRGTMDQQAFMRMLTQIYSSEAAAGVYKLITAPPGGQAELLKRAAGPVGIRAALAEERGYQTTLEAREAKTQAQVMLENLDVTEAETFMEDVRKIGAAKQERYRRRQPIRQWLREFFIIGKEREKEEAAERFWIELLTPEEKREIFLQYDPSSKLPYYERLKAAWEEKSPQEKYQELTEPGNLGPATMEVHYHQDTNYYPRIGSDEGGPRFTQD